MTQQSDDQNPDPVIRAARAAALKALGTEELHGPGFAPYVDDMGGHVTIDGQVQLSPVVRAVLAAALAAMNEAGWRLVPLQPTAPMFRAARIRTHHGLDATAYRGAMDGVPPSPWHEEGAALWRPPSQVDSGSYDGAMHEVGELVRVLTDVAYHGRNPATTRAWLEANWPKLVAARRAEPCTCTDFPEGGLIHKGPMRAINPSCPQHGHQYHE